MENVLSDYAGFDAIDTFFTPKQKDTLDLLCNKAICKAVKKSGCFGYKGINPYKIIQETFKKEVKKYINGKSTLIDLIMTYNKTATTVANSDFVREVTRWPGHTRTNNLLVNYKLLSRTRVCE